MFFGKQFAEEGTFPVHVGRIQPYKRIGREKAGEVNPFRFFGFPGRNVRINIGRFHGFYGKLGVTVEKMDLFHLVSKEGKPIGFIR